VPGASEEAEESISGNIWLVVQFGCFLHLINEYLFEVTMCVGPSMLPTFNDAGDIVVLDRLTTRWNPIKRGDVVVARSPTNPKQTVCKRIRAVEGDTVKMSTYFNNKKISKVPEGHVWLEGDNPSNSTDSRYYGPVPAALINGRVVCKIWPWSEAGWMEGVTSIAAKKKAVEDEAKAKKEAKEEAEAAAAAAAEAAKAKAKAEAQLASEKAAAKNTEQGRSDAEAAPGENKEPDVAANKAKAELGEPEAKGEIGGDDSSAPLLDPAKQGSATASTE
jgi:signal peptidase I